MKLYNTPKSIADLQAGDIVYTIINGQIMQARVADFNVAYDIYSNGIRILDSRQYQGGEKKETYYQFDLPTGGRICKTPKYGERTPDIYLSVEDARNNKALEWQYGYCDTYGNGNKDNQDALERFKRFMIMVYGIHFKDGGWFVFFYNNKRTQQVTEIAFNCIYDQNMGDVRISHCSSDYGCLGEKIEDKIYFATRTECEQAYKPKVLMFDAPEEKLPQDHFIVFKRFFENQEFANDELVGIYDNLNEAVATASMKAYTDNNAIADGLDSNYYFYIVFPCDKNGEGTLDNDVFATPWYSDDIAI